VKSRDLTDPVRTAWLKCRALVLRHFTYIPKHLTRPRKVKTTIGPKFTQRREDEIRAIDVRSHGRKAVSKTFRHEVLRRQVVTLLKIMFAEDMEDAGVTLEIRRMQDDVVQQVTDTDKSCLRSFEGHPPHQPMDLITQAQKIFGQVTSILPGNSSNQRPLRHTGPHVQLVSASDITILHPCLRTDGVLLKMAVL
jgi:hypothetical protein